MFGKLFELLKNIVMLGIFGGIAWYGYSMWNEPSPPVNDAVPAASFNCRTALAGLAKGYACRDSPSCGMTDYELERIKTLEMDIGKYCN